MLVGLAQQVRRRGARRGQPSIRAVAVYQPLAQCEWLITAVPRPEPDRAVQQIVGVQEKCTLAIALLDRIPGGIDHRAPDTRVHTFDAKGAIGEVVHVGKRDPAQRIGDGEQVAPDVVG